MTSAEDAQKSSPWSAGIKNGLNIRVHLLRSVTKKIGEDYYKTEAGADSDLPSDTSLPDYLGVMEESIAEYLSTASPLASTSKSQPSPLSENRTATPPSPRIAPPDPSAPITPASLPTMDSLISQHEWEVFNKTLKQMPSKPDGWWAFSDKPESAKIVALLRQRADRGIVFGSYSYTLSKDGRFLNRWPHREEKP